jgi:hypothetical protein
MRALGHETAREEREERIAPLDSRLQEAWEQCVLAASRNYLFDQSVDLAQELLYPLAPTQRALERLIITIPIPEEDVGTLLGLFLTAGLSLLPEKELVYSLHTPHINYLGYHIEKDLTITGTLGAHAGSLMVGSLTNHGSLGDYAGSDMIGSFVNHGVLGFEPGRGMIGSFVNHGSMGENACADMCGRFEDASGVEWENFHGYPPFFFYDLKNPEGHKPHTLHRTLLEEYERKYR